MAVFKNSTKFYKLIYFPSYSRIFFFILFESITILHHIMRNWGGGRKLSIIFSTISLDDLEKKKLNKGYWPNVWSVGFFFQVTSVRAVLSCEWFCVNSTRERMLSKQDQPTSWTLPHQDRHQLWQYVTTRALTIRCRYSRIRFLCIYERYLFRTIESRNLIGNISFWLFIHLLRGLYTYNLSNYQSMWF